MINYTKLSKKPRAFRRFTGFTIEEYDMIYEKIESKYDKFEKKRLDREDRKRAIGGGRNFDLELEDRFLMFIIYYRLYLTYFLLGFLFDLDQSNVCRNIKYLELLIKAVIPIPQKLHKKTKKIGDIDELLNYFPEMKAFIDTTEQEIPRPKNKRRRKNYYSGKKKRHTVKTQIMVNKRGIILHKGKYFKGRQHDYDYFKKKGPPLVPSDIEVGMDLGFQGVKNDFPDLNSKIPIKKKKGKELLKKDKRANKKHSKERVVVEHSFAKMKKYRVMGNEFRNRLNRYDDVVSIVSGFVNFKLLNFYGYNLDNFLG